MVNCIVIVYHVYIKTSVMKNKQNFANVGHAVRVKHNVFLKALAKTPDININFKRAGEYERKEGY